MPRAREIGDRIENGLTGGSKADAEVAANFSRVVSGHAPHVGAQVLPDSARLSVRSELHGEIACAAVETEIGELGFSPVVPRVVALEKKVPNGSRLLVRCVLKAPVALFASREYLARAPIESLEAPDALNGHRALLPAGDLALLPEARWLAAQPGIVPVFASDSFPALLAAAVRGLGVVPVSAAWGSREPELVRLFDVPNIPARSIWLVSSDASNPRAACRLVADRLVELFAKVTKRVQ